MSRLQHEHLHLRRRSYCQRRLALRQLAALQSFRWTSHLGLLPRLRSVQVSLLELIESKLFHFAKCNSSSGSGRQSLRQSHAGTTSRFSWRYHRNHQTAHFANCCFDFAPQ